MKSILSGLEIPQTARRASRRDQFRVIHRPAPCYSGPSGPKADHLLRQLCAPVCPGQPKNSIPRRSSAPPFPKQGHLRSPHRAPTRSESASFSAKTYTPGIGSPSTSNGSRGCAHKTDATTTLPQRKRPAAEAPKCGQSQTMHERAFPAPAFERDSYWRWNFSRLRLIPANGSSPLGPSGTDPRWGLSLEGLPWSLGFVRGRSRHRPAGKPNRTRPRSKAGALWAVAFQRPRERRILSAARRGFGAPVMGRPMTSQSAPASMASRGVKVRR